MSQDLPRFRSVEELLRAEQPVRPVYCLYPELYRAAARRFLAGFPGRVLYAVKANDHPAVLDCLALAGVRHFDCASVPEIELARQACPDASCYFMTPVRLRGAARAAWEQYAVRHFMVDDASGLDLLDAEIDLPGNVVFVRMAVQHPGALQNFSGKFGANPDDVPALLEAVRSRGAEPALAFNVGSSVIAPEAYSDALTLAAGLLSALPFRIRLVDIGGGFPVTYPGFEVPGLSRYFEAISVAAQALPLADGGELMAEPGRALAAPGLSALTQVLLRKEQRLYLNDGMYGIFWELRFKAHERYEVAVYRDGERLAGETLPFRLFGPTCDGSDVLPGEVSLPEQIRPGDYLDFQSIGAYSLAGRTRFNGHYSDQIVVIDGPGAEA